MVLPRLIILTFIHRVLQLLMQALFVQQALTESWQSRMLERVLFDSNQIVYLVRHQS